MFIEKVKGKIFNVELGLEPLSEDSRDLGAFSFWGLGGFFYKPKHIEKILKLFPVLKQWYNTCGWTGETGMKEPDENKRLSPRGFVMIGKMLGYISGDGFSNLRNNEKALQKMGIPELGFFPESANGWSDYCNIKRLTPKVRANAILHRSKSYLRLYNTGEVYKAIDEDRPVSIGIDWYSGFNMSGGFKDPWIIHKPMGYRVGGHKMFAYGYNTNYKGQKVFKVRNSFGEEWGDKGDLYITEDFLSGQISKYGAFINHDLELTTTEWIIQNNYQLVKTEGKSTVYFIMDGKKRPFMSMKDFNTFVRITPIFSYPKVVNDIKIISNKILDAVPLGPEMPK